MIRYTTVKPMFTQDRSKLPLIGIDAVKEVAALFETQLGVLTGLSIFESKYSTGNNGTPDLVFRQYGIEIKNIERYTRSRGKGSLKVNSASWRDLKKWCCEHHKRTCLIVRLTDGLSRPVFVLLKAEQIDGYEREFNCRNKQPLVKKCRNYRGRFFSVSFERVLHDGVVLHKGNFEKLFGVGEGFKVL